MSDATLPPPRSSPAPITEDGNKSDPSSMEVDSDTSLVLSSDVISKEDGLAGRIENKQKRKRTSSKDQAILEAEFTQDPKPNKAARAIIVEKVDMNEKEVQIWFQNRRQINRRKSRPLLPHEIAAFGVAGMAGLSQIPALDGCFGSSQILGESMKMETVGTPGGYGKEIVTSREAGEALGLKEMEKDEEPMKQKSPDANPGSQISVPSILPTLKAQSSSEISSTQTSLLTVTETVSKSFSSTPGYIANRWNTVNSSYSTPSSSYTAPFATPSIFEPVLPSSCPERIGSTSSKVRLSMSLEGKAELISSEPSPPREQPLRPSSSGSLPPQRRAGGLQRSQSAYAFEPYSRSSPTIDRPIPRLTSGRSRDARTWEFCCDPEAHDELTKQAETESSGSAVAAISLIRSSSKTALKSNSNKRNAPSAKQESSAHGKKPKLGRAMSSLARLQGTGMQSSKSLESNKGQDYFSRSPSGDSDKENWIPGENGGNSRRRALPAVRTNKLSSSKSVLGDNFNVPTDALNLGGPRNKRRKGAYVEPKVFEDQEDSGETGEVEQFMRGDISPSKKGDLDCVQGLLSLSQGNWR